MNSYQKNLGFSLFELVITIIILSILLSIGYIKWGQTSLNFLLNQQTAILANNLRLTQNLSMSQNEPYRLTINSTQSYTIKDPKGNSQNIPGIGLVAQLNSNISFILPPQGFIKSIIFDGQGTPFTDTAPESQLTSEATITLKSHDGQTKTIRISPNTGRIFY